MAIEADELLIFKNRKLSEAKKPEQVRAVKAQKPEPSTITSEPSVEPIAQVVREEAAKGAKVKYGDLNGVACTNHPWRQAYGICAYCDRPFCYPDTTPYNGKLYCLEDIDQVSRMPPKSAEQRPHFWTYLASVIFIISAISLTYAAYPSLYFVVQYVQANGFSGLLNYVLVNYTFPLIDLVAAILCLASGIIIVRNNAPSFAFSGAILGATIIIVSYEYLSTNAQYLFFVVLAMIFNLAIIAVGRMNILGTSKAKPFYTQVDWPRPEVF